MLNLGWNQGAILARKRAPKLNPFKSWFRVQDIAVNCVYSSGYPFVKVYAEREVGAFWVIWQTISTLNWLTFATPTDGLRKKPFWNTCTTVKPAHFITCGRPKTEQQNNTPSKLFKPYFLCC